MFCLYSLSLYISMTSVHLLSSLFTLGGEPSGGHELNLKSIAMTGLFNESASLRSVIQFSLCRYLGVMQHISAEHDFIPRCELLSICDDSDWILEEVIPAVDLLLMLLWPRICAPLSTQHTRLLASNVLRISST